MEDLARENDEEFKTMVKWLKRQGLQPENYPCEPYIFENTGRGIRATKDLEPGTVVLEIAETVIFTGPNIIAMCEEIQKILFYLEQNEESIESISIFILFLIFEKQKDSRSKAFGYIQQLPAFYTVPLCWMESEIDMLPDNIQNMVHEDKNEYKELFVQLKELTTKVFPDNSAMEPLLWADFLWAVCSFKTRYAHIAKLHKYPKCVNFGIYSNGSMAPFIDLFNHGANQATKSGYDPRRGTFQVICENFIKKGDQIFIEYGEKKDNTSLLLEYGFVMPNNPFDKIQISKTDLNEASQKYQNKFQLTRLATKSTAESDWYIYKDTVSNELFRAMLILCSANETIAEAKILDYKELEFKDMQLRISETIFQKLCYLLKNLVENKRKNIMKQQPNAEGGRKTLKRGLALSIFDSHILIYEKLFKELSLMKMDKTHENWHQIRTDNE